MELKFIDIHTHTEESNENLLQIINLNLESPCPRSKRGGTSIQSGTARRTRGKTPNPVVAITERLLTWQVGLGLHVQACPKCETIQAHNARIHWSQGITMLDDHRGQRRQGANVPRQDWWMGLSALGATATLRRWRQGCVSREYCRFTRRFHYRG